MTKKLWTLLIFLLFATSVSMAQMLPQPAAASPPAATPVGSSPPATTTAPPDAATAKPALVLPLTPITNQLGQTLQSLVAGTPSGDNPDDAGAYTSAILDHVGAFIDRLKNDSAAFTANLKGIPDFIDWVSIQNLDLRRAQLWAALGNDLLIIVGVPLLASCAVALLLLPLRLNLRRALPATLPGRLGLLSSLFVLRMVPVVIFLTATLTLLNQNETRRLPRYIVLDVIYALSASYSLRQVLRAFFAPTVDHLRFLSMNAAQARYACRWLSAFAYVMIPGYFLVDIATALHVPAASGTVLQNILACALVAMAVVLILQTRMSVGAILRGSFEPDESMVHALRGWMGRRWHIIAVAFLLLSLIVILLGVDNGFGLMMRGMAFTFGLLVASRMSFVAIERWSRTTSNGVVAHRRIISFLLRPFIWIVAAFGIAAAWGMHPGQLITTPFGQKATNAIISISVTLGVLTLIYEVLDAAVERHLNRRDPDGGTTGATARARTLLPMVRNTIFVVFSAVAVLTLLSAVGINIAPVLAGAGIFGVAIGFGSQSLVKDFLTGLFIIAENTIAIGDVVTISTFTGVVEAMSMRTIRLRDLDGALHVLTFSEVTKFTNLTKDFAYAVVDIDVSFNSNLEHVMQVLRDIGSELQHDAVFQRVILEPIEIMGVEKFTESAITIRVRLRTRPGKQWDIKRLMLLKIQQRFATENIEIPYPTVTHIMRSDSA